MANKKENATLTGLEEQASIPVQRCLIRLERQCIGSPPLPSPHAKSPASIMTGPIPDLVQEFVSAGEATLHFVIACAVLLLTAQPPLAKRGQSSG